MPNISACCSQIKNCQAWFVGLGPVVNICQGLLEKLGILHFLGLFLALLDWSSMLYTKNVVRSTFLFALKLNIFDAFI